MTVSLWLAALIVGTTPTAPAPITSGPELIRAMQAKYPNWYRKLSFVQRAIYADGRPEEEWWEAALLPGRLRIDVAPVDAGKAFLYKGDSNYVFQDGKVRALKRQNILLIMAFDVYRQPAEKTIAAVTEEKFDLGTFREDSWRGTGFYVIGAPGQELWIEKERLLLWRVVEKEPSGGGSLEFIFEKFAPLAGGWIGTEVLFLRNGKEFFREIYRDWKVDEAVTDDLFNTEAWKRAGWIPKH
jgi:hypothetical protein